MCAVVVVVVVLYCWNWHRWYGMQILVDFNCYYEIVECDLCEQLIIREDSLPDYLFVKQNYRKTTTKNE